MADTIISVMSVNGTKVRVYASTPTTIWVSVGREQGTDPMLWTRLGLDELHQVGAINLANTTFVANVVKENEELKEKVRVLTAQRNKAKMDEELKRDVPRTLTDKVKAAVDILKS